MEVVFASSDKDEDAFHDYYSEMPWLALPYAARDLKAKLSKKFKVQGIPSLILLQPDGTLITDKARDKIDQPATYPWIPQTLEEILADAKIVSKDGVVSHGASLKGKPVAFYFSAHWCPPCRNFTPELAKAYNDGLKDKMEVVFVSADKDQKSFEEYFSEQPWKALAFDDEDSKRSLSEKFGVEGYPTVVVVGADGKIVTHDGRSLVATDPKAEKFPEGWLPQPINDVNDNPSDLNGETCFLVYAPDDAAAAAMTAVAKEHCAAAGGVIEDMKYRFYTGKEGNIMSQIRTLTKTPDEKTRLAILDLPAGGKYYVCDAGEVTETSIKKLINDYENKTVEMKQLER
jgi:nucleoredoxin